jgi:hypothetical protein
MDWSDFSAPAGQLGVLIALTGLIYRLMRLRWPETPEPVVQFIAAILASASNLAISYRPESPRYQWIILGLASGIFLSQNVVKSIDWITAAASKTGAPEAGIAEKPPAWFVAELAKGATVESTAPVQVRSLATLAEQQQANAEAVAKVAPAVARTLAEVHEKAQAQAKKDAAAVTPKRVPPPPSPDLPPPSPFATP